jgi:hypothetical protein
MENGEKALPGKWETSVHGEWGEGCNLESGEKAAPEE